MLGDHPLSVGYGTHSAFCHESVHYAFAHVAATLSRADLAFGNLECTLSGHGLKPGHYPSIQLRGQPSYVEALRRAGFGVMCVANNHSMQHGREAFIETTEALRGAGISVCGLAGENYRSVVPTVVDRHGLRIVFLGWSLRPRGYFASGPLYAEGYREDMLKDVKAARERHDCVVVTLHWGDEYVERPSPAEIGLAREIMDAGADLIIGHHPHVLRGCERYGRGWILYSLGNFVSDMTWSESMRESVIAECRLTAQGVDHVEFLPARIADDYRPVMLQDKAAEALIGKLQTLSREIERTPPQPVTEAAAAKYLDEAIRALALERRRSRVHFLKSMKRAPPRVVIQQLATFIRNRIAERG
jgi:poly-gamma-glutamate synthesis protein (capsule biosynthesis protein)